MAEKVALLDSINLVATEYFSEQGLEVIEFPKSIILEDFKDLVKDASLLGLRSGPKVPGEVIESSEKLEAIGCFCVGTNHVEQSVANENGVAIFNSIHENTRSVAEYVIASVFSMLRRVSEHSKEMHSGTWTKTDELSYEVRGKTIGIIGYGAIGSQVSVLAEGVGMDVVYYDPSPKMPPHGRARLLESMEEVLETADVVTLHVPGGSATNKMINTETLSLMKRGSYLINSSRGGVVDYQAVAEAIESGQLAGAAVDVFEEEPAKTGDDFNHILRGVGRAVLTPHIAGSTIEAQRDIGSLIALKLLTFLRTGNSVGSVNLPELALNGVANDERRLLYIHDNTPGVLAKVTSMLAELDLNIVRSTQNSNQKMAYVAFDVAGDIPEDTFCAIKDLPETRRLRII